MTTVDAEGAALSVNADRTDITNAKRLIRFVCNIRMVLKYLISNSLSDRAYDAKCVPRSVHS